MKIKNDGTQEKYVKRGEGRGKEEIASITPEKRPLLGKQQKKI